MESKTKELVKAGHDLVVLLGNQHGMIDAASLVQRLTAQLDITAAALREKSKQCDQLAAENAEQKPVLSQAIADIIAERQRQIAVEGWTQEHDDEHGHGELAAAAACYALLANHQGFSTPAHWPWSPDWWKQTSERNDLIKAGALIAAEIERIDRTQLRNGEAV